MTQKKRLGEFPGGPVVRTPRFHCCGGGFNLWLGNEDPTSQVAWPKKDPKNKQKKEKTG